MPLFRLFILTAIVVITSARKGHEGPTSSQDFYSDEYADHDTSSDEEAEYEQSSEEELDNEIRTWRRVLNIAASKMRVTTPASVPESSIRRSIVLATPLPPTPPNVDDIDAIRQNLIGKSLEDTIFSNNTHYKMAVSFSSSDGHSNKATKDLQMAICLMDCQVAQASSMVSGFRGKDALKAEEDKLEKEWNNMTDIEKEFITVITSANMTRRSSRPLVATFQIFSDWCSTNCDEIKKKSGSRGSKKHKKRREFTNTTPAPESEEDSAEKEKENGTQRRAEDLEDTGGTSSSPAVLKPSTVPLTVQVPVPDILMTIFGEKAVTAMKGPTLCLCGTPSQKLCYCQSGKQSAPLVTMTPSFT